MPATRPARLPFACLLILLSGLLFPGAARAQGPPSVPSGVTATPASGQVTVAWNTVTGATSYDVYRATASGQEGSTPYVTGITTTSYVNTGLTNGTKYFYQVTAVNTYGQSAKSSEASATPGAPLAPTGLTATAVSGQNQITLSWTASSGATAYNVYRGTSAGGESSTALATGVTITAFTDTSGINQTTYYYKVTATNPYESAYSNEAHATDTGPPPPPTNLALQNGISTDGQVALQWSASATATAYNLWRSDVVGVYQPGLTTASFTDKFVSDGTAYTYQVTAINSYGESAASIGLVVTPVSSFAFNATPQMSQVTGGYPPQTNWQQQLPPPTGLKCTDLPLGIRVDWTPPSATGLPAFHIAWQRSTSATFPAGATTTGSTWDQDGGNYIIDQDAAVLSTPYYFRIQTVPNNASNFQNGVQYVPSDSISLSVTLGQATVVDNQAIDARYDLRYGNPTYLDFQFGSMIYAGGLYVGNATDNSRMGRSLLRFTLPNLGSQSVWAGGLNAFFEGAVATGSGWTVGAQPITDNGWAASTVSWETAPAFTPANATSTCAVSYNTGSGHGNWCHWNLTPAVPGVLSTGGTFDVGLAMTTESSDQTNGVNNWTYFAKKEFDSTKAAAVVWGTGGNLGTVSMSVNPTSVHGAVGNTSTGTVTLLNPAPTGGAVVNLYVSCVGNAAVVPVSVTVPAGQSSTSFTITTNTVTQSTPVTIYGVYQGASVGAILTVF